MTSLAVFDRGSNGALTPVPGSPLILGNYFAGQIVSHPSGNFLFMQDQVRSSTDRIRVYRIGNDGLPTEIAGSPFETDGENIWGGTGLLMHPSGSFVLTSNFDTRNISVLKVNGTTGALSAVAGSPFRTGAAPGGLAVTPDGKFVYITSRDEHAIYGFSIDANSGVLTPIAGSPFATPAGGDPLEIVVDRAGRGLYAVDQGVQRLVPFQLDPTTGALTAVGGNPVTTGPNPWAIVVVP
jgi:6-phosphogluconolactonase (cycloisomerase 2 family)